MEGLVVLGCLGIVGFVIFVIGSVGYSMGQFVEETKWESDCIERGFAEYNSKTGDWQWKNHNEA